MGEHHDNFYFTPISKGCQLSQLAITLILYKFVQLGWLVGRALITGYGHIWGLFFGEISNILYLGSSSLDPNTLPSKLNGWHEIKKYSGKTQILLLHHICWPLMCSRLGWRAISLYNILVFQSISRNDAKLVPSKHCIFCRMVSILKNYFAQSDLGTEFFKFLIFCHPGANVASTLKPRLWGDIVNRHKMAWNQEHRFLHF